MEKIEVFMANDGKIFVDEEKCKEHEKNLSTINEINDLLCSLLTENKFLELLKDVRSQEVARKKIFSKLSEELVLHNDIVCEVLNNEQR